MNRLVCLIVSSVKEYFERNKWVESEDDKGRFTWSKDGMEAVITAYKYDSSGEVSDIEIKIKWRNHIDFIIKVSIRGKYVTGMSLYGDITIVNESALPVSVVSSMYVVAYELYELIDAIAKPYRP